MESWEEEYQRKFISAQEAAELVKSGDRVVIPAVGDPLSLELSLIARKEELTNVEVQVESALRDLPWYDASWQDSFDVRVWHILEPNVRRMINERGADMWITLPYLFSKAEEERIATNKKRTIIFVEVSPPDKNGFCSFGPVFWDKKDKIKSADIAIAEIRKEFIRTYGDNFIHVSDIDYFVQTDYPAVGLGPPPQPEPHSKAMVQYISELIRDGDTLQVGVGKASEGLALAGLFNGRRDLGWHTERLPRGFLQIIKQNPDMFNGSRKTLNPGKITCCAAALTGQEDADFVDGNPMFELYSPTYIHDIRVISAHDNMVAINNAFAIDLTGQVSVETVGSQIWGSVGGQLEFTIGAILSKGGRAFTVLPSTAANGAVSRIVPMLPQGSYVSIPRTFVHYVVTEYGRACLLGKTQRERARELIAIAHPNFRDMLRKEAEKIF